MKRVFCFLTTVLVAIVAVGVQSKMTPIFPYSWGVEAVQKEFDGRHVDLEFWFRPNKEETKSVSVTVQTKNGIIFDGPSSWTVQFDAKADTNRQILHLVVPPNDTSEIDFVLKALGEGRVVTITRVFVTRGDSIEYWHGWPQKAYSRPESDTADRDTLKQSDLDHVYNVGITLKTPEQKAAALKILGFAPETDQFGRAGVRITLRKLYELDEAGVPCESLTKDDTPSFNGLDNSQQMQMIGPLGMASDDAKKEIMKRREQTPLLDKNTEAYYIDGEMWQRIYGETEFRKITPITDVDTFLRQMNDSIQALPPDHLFDICLMLTDDKEISQAISIAGNLPGPVDSVYYHVELTRRQITELAKSKIRFSYIMNGRCVHDSLSGVGGHSG